MQQVGEGTEADRAWALNALPAQVDLPKRSVTTPPEIILRLAHAATLIADTFQATVKFSHHLLQEYFAAHEMHRRLGQGEDLAALWRVPTSQREMPPDERKDRWDPLPGPPTSRWEQTTILAAGLDPGIVERVRAVNPVRDRRLEQQRKRSEPVHDRRPDRSTHPPGHAPSLSGRTRML